MGSCQFCVWLNKNAAVIFLEVLLRILPVDQYHQKIDNQDKNSIEDLHQLYQSRFITDHERTY